MRVLEFASYYREVIYFQNLIIWLTVDAWNTISEYKPNVMEKFCLPLIICLNKNFQLRRMYIFNNDRFIVFLNNLQQSRESKIMIVFYEACFIDKRSKY